MKKKIGLLVLTFFAFYVTIHLGRYLPDLVNGKFSYIDERNIEQRLLSMITELTLAFLFSFTAYLSLHHQDKSRTDYRLH